MRSVRAVLLRLCCKKENLEGSNLSPDIYDLRAINDRAHKAITRTGRTRIEVAELYGMDSSIPLGMQRPEKVPQPTMETVVKLAVFLGVSVRWMLYGEPENDVDRFVIGQPSCIPSCVTSCVPSCGPVCKEIGWRSASHGGAIIAGAQNSTVVVQNIKGDDLSIFEREMIHSIRALSARDKAAVMSYVFAMAKGNAGINNEPPA